MTALRLTSYNLKYNSGACCIMEASSPPTIRQDSGQGRKKGAHKRKSDRTHACEQPAMQGAETGEKQKEDLENPELDIDAICHAVIYRLEWPGWRRGRRR